MAQIGYFLCKRLCPKCNGRLAGLNDYDVYFCENEHIISGIEMEELDQHGREDS